MEVGTSPDKYDTYKPIDSINQVPYKLDPAHKHLNPSVCLKPQLKVSPDEPIVCNEHGGYQAMNIYAFDLLDAGVLMELARVFGEGAKKYKKDNWRLIPPHEHYAHMMAHLMAWQAGDRQDDHLNHANARMMMMLATERDK